MFTLNRITSKFDLNVDSIKQSFLMGYIKRDGSCWYPIIMTGFSMWPVSWCDGSGGEDSEEMNNAL